MENLIQDIRFAFRTFLKSPGFTAIAILTLALGIGANTAIFTILDSVLLRTLPVHDPEQLVSLTDPDAHGMSNGSEDGDRSLLAYSEFEYLRDHNEVFSGMFAADSSLPKVSITIDSPSAAEESGSFARAGSGMKDQARVSLVSGGYFTTLGIQPAIGRVFGPEVDRSRDSSPVAVISHTFWQRRFAQDPQVIGRRIEIGSAAFEIVGVAPTGFFGASVGESPDLWIPITMQSVVYPGNDLLTAYPDGNIDQRMWLQVMARMKPGVKMAQANAAINVPFQAYIHSSLAGQKLSGDELKDYAKQNIKVQSGARGASVVHSTFAEPLKVLMALVVLVLLIACANLANLLLARGAARQREFAVRLSIGAARGRLIRQLLTESVILSFAGAGLGLVLAQWADSMLLSMAAGADAFQISVRPDARILAFTIGVALLTAVLFGLIPALRATRIDLSPMLKAGASGATAETASRRLPVAKLLVIAQVAVSLVLLVAAGLFVHSLVRLSNVTPGFTTEKMLMFRVLPEPAGYKDAQMEVLYRDLLEKFKAVPGVESVSLSANGLFSNTESGDPISVEGYTPKPGEVMASRMDHVGPDYFAVVGMPIVHGRGIEEQDSAPIGGSAPRVVVINQTFAKRFFPHTDPLGKRIRDTYPGSAADAEVVGVVSDAKYHNLREDPMPRILIPMFNPFWQEKATYFEVRTNGDVASVSSELRKIVTETNPAIPEIEIRTMSSLLLQSMHTDYFIARLASVFGLLAIVLAGIGLYGIMAFTVARRTRDIGIRMTLGASPSSVLRQVLRETLILMVIGIAVGVPIAIAGTRLIRGMLFGLGLVDPVATGAACAVLVAIAMAASYIPARRASRVDPMIALRYE